MLHARTLLGDGLGNPSYRGARRGATLIEMLVVITILVILAGAALPLMRTAVSGSRPRETARAVNVYFSSARNRALETGRPCGVMLTRMDNRPGASMVLQQVEMPPPYAGDSLSSAAQLQVAYGSGTATVTATMDAGFNATLVSVGDLVQFNGQGPWYTVGGVNATTITASINLSAGQLLPWPTASLSPPVPYQILRQPRSSATTPLQLPMGMAVDLDYSGTDAASFGSTDNFPVYLLFSPHGSLDRVGFGGLTPDPVIYPIYLLVGRGDKVGDTTNPNWQDFNNIWVALNPQTGMVTTAPVVSAAGNAVPASVSDSRGAARTAYSMGGRS
jgi:prepilin-type N-terminal cleavage/methylation domain-containing protein